ncbi:MAG: hypothetical protein WCF16_07690 [Alphaproteobacteria bacterium]
MTRRNAKTRPVRDAKRHATMIRMLCIGLIAGATIAGMTLAPVLARADALPSAIAIAQPATAQGGSFPAVNPGQEQPSNPSLSSSAGGLEIGGAATGIEPTFRDTLPSDQSLHGPAPSDRSLQSPSLESGGTLRSESDMGW